MTASDVRSVAERLAQSAPVDVSRVHETIQRYMRGLAERLYAAFPVTPHPLAAPFASYASADGNMSGNLRAFTGAQLDWVIDSSIGSTKFGFCNHHLTIWLPPSLKVPHLAFAIGTIPQLFVFCDLVPRADLWVDTESLDRYHARFNQRRLDVAADARFSPFVSKEIYIRGALSPVGLCLQAEVTDTNLALAFEWCQQTLTQWIEWVKAAPLVPEAERAALAARDRLVRDTICLRDPANVVAERVLGVEMTERLVNVLRGVGREAK